LLPTDFEKGVMVGLLIGEGHFGGDGRQPHVTLRMHARHEALFHWIQQTFPGGKLYGPYNHDGRNYLQWMARGSYLREVLVPLLDEHLTADLDTPSAERYGQMKARYQRRLGITSLAALDGGDDLSTSDDETPGGSKSAEGLQRSNAAEIFDRIRRAQGD